jgi:CO/xanthine dehydrogenase Mo-binding subunit
MTESACPWNRNTLPFFLPPDVEPSPEATYVWAAPGQKPPDEQGQAKTDLMSAHSCHLAVVEVDLKTGQVRVLGYYAADDCGVRLNPAIVEGMIQGGVDRSSSPGTMA